MILLGSKDGIPGVLWGTVMKQFLKFLPDLPTQNSGGLQDGRLEECKYCGWVLLFANMNTAWYNKKSSDVHFKQAPQWTRVLYAFHSGEGGGEKLAENEYTVGISEYI